MNNVMDQRKRSLARNRALAALAKAHRDEYQALYRSELGRIEGPVVRVSQSLRDEVDVDRNEEPLVSGPCTHERSEMRDGVRTCLDCGATRPRWSWIGPEGQQETG